MEEKSLTDDLPSWINSTDVCQGVVVVRQGDERDGVGMRLGQDNGIRFLAPGDGEAHGIAS